jgi:hypothetical protein
MSEAKPVTINADMMWSSLTEVNRMSGKYQVDLANLSKAASEALEMMGLNVRNKPGQGDFITAKSSHPIRIYDTDGAEIKGILVGNGSKAKAVVSYYDWKSPAGQAGRSPTLLKLVVTDLIPYGGGADVAEVDLGEAL